MRCSLAALLLSGCCGVGATADPLGTAALEKERAARLEQAGAGYSAVVARPPFVVVAYGPADVREDAVRTIAWAGERLRTSLFEMEPAEPITVWVFGDEESYMRGSSAVLGIVPETPYGFYRPCKRAIVVDAGYGWGTLIHEMVHAYMDADFPSAPVWLEEGLASLYENAIQRDDGTIAGAPNWRLAGLKRALERSRAPSFHRMASAGRGDFHGKDGHLFYATARYLCFWLQENALLQRFYRAHRRRGGEGLDVLRDVTARETAALRSEWEGFVMGLGYERRSGNLVSR
jgi:hypothetical protein